ncbi:MAG: hypothetical protein NC489_45245, partial [Ruminococcus flavefaciens]|nr:hypothetical protein [Ruminococcus flavefaciens]
DYGDLGKYYDVSATFGEGTSAAPLAPNGGKYLTDDAGEYKLTFTIKSKFGTNVTWDDGGNSACTAQINLNPYEIDVTGWNTDRPPKAQFAGGYCPNDYYTYEYTERATGNIATLPLAPSTNYTATIKIADKYIGNVVFTSTSELSKDFTSDRANSGNPTLKKKPHLSVDKLEYNKQEQTFTLVDYDSNVMSIASDSDALTQSAVNKYKITILILNDATNNYAWDDGTAEGSLDPLVLEFEVIKKSVLLPSVDLSAVVYTGELITYIPDGFDSEWMTIADNTGTDAGMYKFKLNLVEPDSSYWVASLDNGEQVANMSFVKTSEGETPTDSEWPMDWRINEVRLDWSNQGGAPKLTIPAEFADIVEVTYVYTDEEGNTVAEEDLQKGVKYKVRAVLGDDCAKNFGINEAMLDFDENEFVIGGGFLGFIQDNWLWLVIALSALLLLLLLLLLIRSNKRKKAKALELAEKERIAAALHEKDKEIESLDNEKDNNNNNNGNNGMNPDFGMGLNNSMGMGMGMGMNPLGMGMMGMPMMQPMMQQPQQPVVIMDSGKKKTKKPAEEQQVIVIGPDGKPIPVDGNSPIVVMQQPENNDEEDYDDDTTSHSHGFDELYETLAGRRRNIDSELQRRGDKRAEKEERMSLEEQRDMLEIERYRRERDEYKREAEEASRLFRESVIAEQNAAAKASEPQVVYVPQATPQPAPYYGAPVMPQVVPVPVTYPQQTPAPAPQPQTQQPIVIVSPQPQPAPAPQPIIVNTSAPQQPTAPRSEKSPYSQYDDDPAYHDIYDKHIGKI